MKKRLLTFGLLLSTASLCYASGGSEEGGIPWGTIVKQAVNFAILAGALAYLLKTPLSNFFKDRSDSMRKAIDDAAAVRKEAADRLAAIDAKMAGLSGEVERMTKAMNSDAEAEAARLREAAQVEMERIRQQATFAAEQEVRKAKAELRAEASSLAVSAAEEVVRKTITPADQERLVRENIEKIREIVQ